MNWTGGALARTKKRAELWRDPDERWGAWHELRFLARAPAPMRPRAPTPSAHGGRRETTREELRRAAAAAS